MPRVDGEDATLVREPSGGGPVASTDVLPPGARVGRYVVLDLLGQGGMGVVYAAYDPELDRKVAIKLLRDTRGGSGSHPSAGQARLLREAQAMAQLSHDNVVRVYDVGSFKDSVFIAMELIHGVTLLEWLNSRRPPWREALSALLAAGRGLQAAHEVGLIHRDFKPANILIGPNDHVYVTDFGLARSTRRQEAETVSDPKPAPLLNAPVSTSSSTLRDPLTQVGTMMGSPGYMAPEQYLGTSDALADQFSFCVTLYEALYAERPHEGSALIDLARAAGKHQIRPPPRDTRVPVWIRRALLKGLSPAPADRYPSMKALLAELSRDPAAARRRWLSLGLGAAVLCALGGGLAWTVRQQSRICRGAESRLEGVWDDAVRSRARDAFGSTGKAFAAAAWERVQTAMDAQARAWTQARTEACEATRVRHEQSEAALASRMACLDHQLEELSTLAQVFATADSAVVEKSSAAVADLSPPNRCDPARALREKPLAPEVLRVADHARQELAQGKALKAAGKILPAFAKLQAAAAKAATVGSPQLTAETLTEFALVTAGVKSEPEARRLFEEAAGAAEEAADDELAATVLTDLVSQIGYRLEQPEQSRPYALLAKGIIGRIGHPPRLEGKLAEALADVAWQDGRQKESLDQYRVALRLYESGFGAESHEAARVHGSLGWVLGEARQYADADRELRRALALTEKLFGPDHPSVGAQWNALGSLLSAEGDDEEAARSFTRALTIEEGTVGKDHPALLPLLSNLSGSLALQGDSARALAVADRAAQLAQSAPNLLPTTLAFVEQCRSHALMGENRLPEAIAASRKAVGYYSGNDADRRVPEAWAELAEELNKAGQYREALQWAEKTLGAKYPNPDEDEVRASGFAESATALAHLGQRREALERLERALRMLEPHDLGTGQLADVRFRLARLLWEDPAQRTRATELAGKAAEVYRRRHKQAALARVESWLEHPQKER